MKRHHFLSAVALAAAMVLPAGLAHAVLFTGSFAVADFNEPANPGPGQGGLNILTDPIVGGTPGNNSLSFNLINPGDSTTIDLFDIWTDETAFNSDDSTGRPISVAFNFTAPPGTTGGPSSGTTDGITIFIASWGDLSWNNPTLFNFGAGGQFQLVLSNETFNGAFGTSFNPGRANGATVQGTFTLISVPAVPEPGTLGLLGTGLLGMGLAAWRRRRGRVA